MQISLLVNNKSYAADVEPRTTLADFLRDTLQLTGTKIGCDTGQCGTCTVMLNGSSVKSCLTLAVQADGLDVGTIEGVAANGRLNDLQEGFRERHGLQCGFCTPGMVMSLTDLLGRIPSPNEAEIRTALDGNLCRCTGYQNVVSAVLYSLEKVQSRVAMIVDTPGKRFYQRQVELLFAGNADALVDENYHDEAVLTTATKDVIKGKPALKQFFRNYLKYVQIKKVLSTDVFVETDDTIQFEATIEANTGIAKVYDAFVLREGKIVNHFTGVK